MTINLLMDGLKTAVESYPIKNPEVFIKDAKTGEIISFNTIDCRNIDGVYLVIKDNEQNA